VSLASNLPPLRGVLIFTLCLLGLLSVHHTVIIDAEANRPRLEKMPYVANSSERELQIEIHGSRKEEHHALPAISPHPLLTNLSASEVLHVQAVLAGVDEHFFKASRKRPLGLKMGHGFVFFLLHEDIHAPVLVGERS
jgi:hypothetical protein